MSPAIILRLQGSIYPVVTLHTNSQIVCLLRCQRFNALEHESGKVKAPKVEKPGLAAKASFDRRFAGPGAGMLVHDLGREKAVILLTFGLRDKKT